MSSPLSPAEMRAYIVERLVGDTGEPDHIIPTAKGMAERALPMIRQTLADCLATPVTIDIGRVELTRFAMMPPANDNSAMTIVSSPASPDALVMMIDPSAVAILVSALFGGDPSLPVGPLERALSPTELEVATLAFDAVAKAYNGSGPRGLAFNLPVGNAVSGAAARELVVRDGPAVLVELAIAAGTSSGRLSLLMPQRVLMKSRDDRMVTTGPAVQSEDDWGERFGGQVMRSAVKLEATMPVARMTLDAVSRLQAGQLIEFRENAQGEAKLSARNKTLFVCELGKLGQNYTVRVKHAFDARQDLIEGLVRR